MEVRLSAGDPPTARSAGPRPLVVTGASRGIGRATALAASAKGQRVCLLGRPSERMHATQEECRRLGADVTFIPCDLGDTAQIEAAAAHVLEFGPPLALINNAGIVERAPLSELRLDSYRRQMDVNLLGPIWLTKCLLEPMRASGSGRIVNVGSISGTLGSAAQIVYNASKWALIGFTKSLAQELTDSGVSVVTLLPGAVSTDMTAGGPYPPRMSADDVAKVLLYYALEAPLAHNGANIEMFGD